MNGNTVSINSNLITAAAKGDTEAVRLLLARGADVNAKDGNNQSVLMRAAYEGHTAAVKLLLENGADINTQDDAGWTALKYAEELSYGAIAQLLINAALNASVSPTQINQQTVFQSTSETSPNVLTASAWMPSSPLSPTAISPPPVEISPQTIQTITPPSGQRDWRDAVIIGSLIGGSIIIGLVLTIGSQFARQPVGNISNSTSTTSSSPSSPSSPITEKQAVNLIANWLQAKRQIFAPPYSRQIAAEITTGELYADLSKSNGPIAWLANNNSYYRFGVQRVDSVERFVASGDRATLEVKVTEDRTLYSNGRIDPNQTDFKTREIVYSLQQVDGKWKIADYK